MAKWYFESNGLQYGPVSVGELRLLAAAGRLKPTDRVRKHSMAKWARAKAVRGLFLPVAVEAAHHPPADELADASRALPDPAGGATAQVKGADPVFDFVAGEGTVTSSAAGPYPGTDEVPVLPVVPVAPGRLVIAEVVGRAVEVRTDGTAGLLDGQTTFQLSPGWLTAITVLVNGPGREAYLRLARLDAAVFAVRPPAAGSARHGLQVLSFHVGRQSAAAAVDGHEKPFRDFLEAVIAAGGGGRR